MEGNESPHFNPWESASWSAPCTIERLRVMELKI
jgi:hypothetical protein